MKLFKTICTLLLLVSSQLSYSINPVIGRIDVRENEEGIREFYNIKTNEKFNPIGFNYISVGNQVPGIQKHTGSHTLFDVNGINGWEQHREHAKKHLPIIASKGYSVVRVFLNYAATGKGGLNATEKAKNPSIDEPYFDNLIEFIGIAKEAGLRVHITIERFPSCYLPFSYPSYSALHEVANKCDLFIQRDLVQAQAKYVEDVLEYLVTKETREAIFSIEPKQEFGLRTIVESQENVITYVKPWGEKEFGPWPENAEETNLEPRTYSLGDQGKDWFQFYKDISYYYPEQLLKAVRKVDKTLLYTISVSGLEQANINTIGFDQRAWHHWAYLPSLAKLGESDMRVYGDLHIYNDNVDNERTASEYPEQIGIVIDRVLASHGIIENLHEEDDYTKTSDWRFENIKIPLVIGEWGARLPRHTKPSGTLLTPTIEDVKFMVTEFTSHIEKRGISGWIYWMYDNSFCLNPEENHASFYTPVEFPELNEILEANELKAQTGTLTASPETVTEFTNGSGSLILAWTATGVAKVVMTHSKVPTSGGTPTAETVIGSTNVLVGNKSINYIKDGYTHIFRLYSGQAGSDVPGDILHTLYVYGDFTLGIEDTKINDSALVVFPNPVANILNVHASSEIQTVQIYTSTGQKLRAITVDGSKEIRVDVSALSPQLYYIEIKTAKGVVLEKLIKE
jgi:transposase-like protein